MNQTVVDVVVLSRRAEPLLREVQFALRGQQGVHLVVHRITGSPQPADANRWQTIACARNRAKSLGSAPWIMFLDDDVVPDLQCVRRLLEGLQSRPAYGALAADYLGELGRANAGHVGMGCTLFRRSVLARVQFRWSPGRCECQCCCDDLRAMGIGIGYFPAGRAHHHKPGDPHARAVHSHEPEPTRRTAAAPHILAAFDRRHYVKFRKQFLRSLRAHENGETVTAVAYGLFPSELRVLACQPHVEVWPVQANGVAPPIRRLRDFQTVLARLPSGTPVAYWDAGDVVFQDSLADLWQEILAHPDKLLAVREPEGHPDNRAVATWTLSIRDPVARRRAFGLLSTRPFLNSGFAAGTAAALSACLREADEMRRGPQLAGSTDWGDQTALNLFCYSNPTKWRESEEGWNYCLHGRQPGEIVIGRRGHILSRRGTAVRVVHGNARSMSRYMVSPYLL
ncbi:MAG: glycosyltransferase family 2 protein [Pirellulales bacterium]